MSPIERNAKDFWTGVVYIAVGGAAIFIGRDYGMGTAMKMGPAYFPMILSGLLILIGVISVLRSFVKSGTPVGTVAWKGLALVIAATVLFGFSRNSSYSFIIEGFSWDFLIGFPRSSS